jgi:hypothetical protein
MVSKPVFNITFPKLSHASFTISVPLPIVKVNPCPSKSVPAHFTITYAQE